MIDRRQIRGRVDSEHTGCRQRRILVDTDDPGVRVRTANESHVKRAGADRQIIDISATPQQKAEIIRKVTDAMVSVEGEKLRGVTWVKINEVAGGDWAIGGRPLQAKDVQRMAAE